MEEPQEKDASVEDDEEVNTTRQRYLDVAGVTIVIAGYKKNKKGYMGILNYSLFCSLYFMVVYAQRNGAPLGLENRALRLPMQLLKPPTKVTTVPEFWAFLDKVFVPWLLTDNSWEGTVQASLQPKQLRTSADFNQTVAMRGARAQQYSQIIGGIALLQTRSLTLPCPKESVFWPPQGAKSVLCYTEELHADLIGHTVTGSVVDADGKEVPVSMTAPYDAEAEAYASLLPSVATPAQLSSLINFMQNSKLVDPATRTIEVRVPVFNGNTNTIGIFSWKLDIDLAGHIHPDLTVSSVPYQLYPDDWHAEVFFQLLLLTWVSFMMRGLWGGYISTHPLPAWLNKMYPDAKRAASKGVMPADPAGRTYILIPGFLFLTILASTLTWCLLVYQYNLMYQQTLFDAKKAIGLFGVKSDSLADLINNNADGVQSVLPLFNVIESLRTLLDRYFYTAALTVVVMIFRMFHYLDFQGKLNAITVTVRTGIGELFHLLVVLNFVVAGFSFLGVLLFGSQVKAYLTFGSAFISTWQSCFGLFALKAPQLKYENPEGGEVFEFLFKLVVTLLLLKMVLAIIFDAYKEAAISTRLTSPTVFADFRRLSFHANNALRGGDGYIPPDLVGKFMKSSAVRMFTTSSGEMVEREVLREDELFPIFKKVMKKEFPRITDQKLQVKCEWLLEHYGRIQYGLLVKGEMPQSTVDMVIAIFCELIRSQIKSLFGTYDDDGSGTISRREFGSILKHLRHPHADDAGFLEASLKVVDGDNSGEIDLEELLLFVSYEMALTVPRLLLPEKMILAEAELSARYIELSETCLNDNAPSIWDSSDVMGQARDPSTAAQTPIPASTKSSTQMKEVRASA